MWAGGGNVGPFVCLAERLQARGHEVAAVATPSLAERLAGAGIEMHASPDGWLPSGDDLTQAIGSYRPDVVIVDYMLTDALGHGEAAGVPTVALVHTLYRDLLVEGAPTPIGMAGTVDDLNASRKAAGLPPIARYADLLTASDVVLVAAPRALDGAGDVPPNVRYAGPLLEGPGPDAGWVPPAGSGPLVVVSLGTAGDRTRELPVLGRIVGALGTMAVRAVVTLPHYIAPDDLAAGDDGTAGDRTGAGPRRDGALPANVTVTGYVRHTAVLPHADLLVTHAGLGSVVAALAHGVPMVTLPLDREQPENARAVVRFGAGLALSSDASVAELRDAFADQVGRSTSPHVTVDPALTVDLLEALAGA
jgi:UDP:flavonoid glycosyltransferase YjiC (YdhE family)